MKIVLNANVDQLNVLLSQLESILLNAEATRSLPRGKMLALAAMTEGPGDFSYDIAHIGPLYLELVKYWTIPGSDTALAMSSAEQIEWGKENLRISPLEVRHA